MSRPTWLRRKFAAIHRSGQVHRLWCVRTRLSVSAIFSVDDLPEKWNSTQAMSKLVRSKKKEYMGASQNVVFLDDLA